MDQAIVAGNAQGQVLCGSEPISFWGGIDPATGLVIDVHHPLRGESIVGKVLMLPGTRGSCTGSGVLLDMILSDRAPAALVFTDIEDVATLGVLVAAELFGRRIPVLRLGAASFAALAVQARVQITPDAVLADGFTLPLVAPQIPLHLTPRDEALLAGAPAEAAAMRILCAMARAQGANGMTDVTRGHIDGCIYASPANLTFAERFAEMGGRVCIPTTMNAISVDRQNWQAQGTPPMFGGPAARLADAYVRMGCQPTFTCAPYLLDEIPAQGEAIAWAESNAVIYANSVLGARTPKHPDFLDLCAALTGRAPLSGVYLDGPRHALRVLDVTMPTDFDDAFWPLLGYVAGRLSPDRIPLLRGVVGAGPEALKALCAAFGTTSSAPMLHIEGITPEADKLAEGADRVPLRVADLAAGWLALNAGPDVVDLVAVGSPHASLQECRALVAALAGKPVQVPVIVTAGRKVMDQARADGTLAALQGAGVQVVADLCWCSISEPVFPPQTKAVMTNSGKYAHYGPGLSGRPVRFGSMADCARAAVTGRASSLPDWLAVS